jgi:hypothetical protein
MNPNERIVLDVGGTLFQTTKSTLCSVDGYFAAMFRSGSWAEEQASLRVPIFIDRGKLVSKKATETVSELFLLLDPTTFSSILSYLRSRKSVFSEKEDDSYLQLFLLEADYYQLADLKAHIQYELEKRMEIRVKGPGCEPPPSTAVYKIVKGDEVSSCFQQNWQFVSQFYGNETFGCIASGTRMETIWFGNRCVACNESMNQERFSKHTTLFQPVMFVVMKPSDSFSSADTNGIAQQSALTFDQSFG